jgi:signal transduction histidine kinase
MDLYGIMRRGSARRIVHACFLIAFLIATTVSYFAFLNTNKFLKTTNLVSGANKVFGLLNSIKLELSEAQSSLLEFSLNRNPDKLREVSDYQDSLGDLLIRYRQAVFSVPLNKYSDSLEASVKDYFRYIGLNEGNGNAELVSPMSRFAFVRTANEEIERADIDHIERLIDRMQMLNNESLSGVNEVSPGALTQINVVLLLSFIMPILILFGFVWLIAYQNRHEQELVSAKLLADESAKAKQRFLANMSHEIRTPMNAIIGITQLMQDTPLDENQKHYLRSLTFAGENLLRIINDVLDVAKIDSGKMSIEKIGFNLRKLIEDVIGTLSYRVKEKNIQFISDISERIAPTLIGDPIRLNQILINILNNAIKFTEAGYVKLTVSEKSKVGNVLLLSFRIEDTGIGIPVEQQSRIFEPFEQAHHSTSRVYGGTGLGLSIVKRLVELQQGKVQVESEEGKGSVFTVELPFVIGSSTESEKKSVEPENVLDLVGKRVLLVEDDLLNQLVAEKYLEGMGLQVFKAENGELAIQKLERNSFDLILMDIQMPVMNGYEATRFIRKHGTAALRNIPILAMTANVVQGEESKCL